MRATMAMVLRGSPPDRASPRHFESLHSVGYAELEIG